MGYLTYVIENGVGVEVSVSDVPVVREFVDLFPEELLGVPLETQVDFKIDLVLGAASIAKTSYRLAPPNMQESSSQLQELLGKQFLRPSSSL